MTTEELLQEAARLLNAGNGGGRCKDNVCPSCAWLAAYEAHGAGAVNDIREAEERGAVKEREACEKIARNWVEVFEEAENVAAREKFVAAFGRIDMACAKKNAARAIADAIAARGKDGR